MLRIRCITIKRTWRSIKQLISNGHLEDRLKQLIYKVFESLASAEKVHRINSEDVHFHEIGAIDSLVDIIGVCAALNYLNQGGFTVMNQLGKGLFKQNTENYLCPLPL